MKIIVNGSGGFAGLSEHYEVDTRNCLPPQERSVTRLLEETRFFDESVPSAQEAVGADFMRWEITVIDDGRERSVRFADDGGGVALRWKPIVDRVRSLQ